MEQVPIMIRLDEDLHEEIRKIAFEERRSINNLVNYIIRKHLEEKEQEKKD